MVSAAKLVFLFLVATVCHWAFTSLFATWGITVNPILIFVTAFCALFKPAIAYSMVFLCGLFLDFFGTKLFGNNAFSFTLCACLVCNFAPRFDFDEFFPQAVAVFGLTWLTGILNTVLVFLFASSSVWPGFFSLLAGSILNGLCAPFVFGFVRWVLRNSALIRRV